MKGSILLVLMALGLVAVSALQFEDLLNDQLDRPAKRQDSGSDSGEDSDESSGEGEIPYPNHRRNMCMSLMHREFKDFYNPIDVHAINKFMTTAKAQTGAVTNEASAAVAAAEAVPAAGASVAQVMFDRIHAFESNTRATVQKQIGRLLGGLQRGLGFILYDGVHGFDDSRQCSTLNDLFVATFKAFKEANMTKEEATEAFGQDTALHASLSSALLDDIRCLEQDVQRVAADLRNFNNATSSTPSRQVVMQAFGYLYDFSNLVRHFREILCEGQIAAFKIKQATYEGSGSGSGQGGNQGSGSGQGGNQGSGSGQGGNQGSGSGQGGNQGSGSGQGGRGGKGGRGGRGGKGPRGAADKRAAEIKLLTLLLRAMDNQ